ncbi:MAG: hypothetical protein LAT82_03045 [Nanoarchaeota archaeon]|nr:hypothetical protein [Nanoarchaeota archaeon]
MYQQQSQISSQFQRIDSFDSCGGSLEEVLIKAKDYEFGVLDTCFLGTTHFISELHSQIKDFNLFPRFQSSKRINLVRELKDLSLNHALQLRNYIGLNLAITTLCALEEIKRGIEIFDLKYGEIESSFRNDNGNREFEFVMEDLKRIKEIQKDSFLHLKENSQSRADLIKKSNVLFDTLDISKFNFSYKVLSVGGNKRRRTPSSCDIKLVCLASSLNQGIILSNDFDCKQVISVLNQKKVKVPSISFPTKIYNDSISMYSDIPYKFGIYSMS